MIQPVDSKTLRALREAGAYMVQHGLAWGNAGNLSLRLDGERCLISASGTNLGDLADEDLVVCALDDPTHAYSRKPSKELPMHTAVYRARPEAGAVLHGAPFYATLAACSNLELPNDWFVEDMYYLERTAKVAYHHPGSSSLAEAVEAAARKANLLLLENHGVLVFDSNLAEALMGLHTLEIVCRMAWAARSAGLEMNPVPPAQVKDFLERSGYRPPRAWPGKEHGFEESGRS
jgi:3-dehydro-4-phosphotetronate decarboxylase